MTIDSRYFFEEKKPDSEVEYPFNMENLGKEAVKVYLIREDGTRILLACTGVEYVEY